MAYLSITAEARACVTQVVRPGDLVVDATLGKGQDCCFLAGLVGPEGLVVALDIQPEAIATSRARLKDAGLVQRVWLIQDSHARLAEHLPKARPLTAAMFNLGYLPGADKACITRPESTLAGLSACLERLKPGGLVSLVAYLGHPGGLEEYEGVRRMLESLDGQTWQWRETRAPSDRAPRLLCCWRL